MSLSEPINVTRIAKSCTPFYVSICNPENRIIACKSGNFDDFTPVTDAEFQAQMAATGITSLPAKLEGRF